jgi:hypothetical protein
MKWIPLETAARRLDMDPDHLRVLCEGPDLDCHGAVYGSDYVVADLTVERLEKRKARLAASPRESL